MNPRRRIFARATHAIAAAVVAATLLPADQRAAVAADITKANNTNSLNLGTSWTGGTAPGTGDVGVFDSTYTQSGALSTGAVVTVGGLRVSNPSNAVLVNNSTAGQELAVGSSGLDLSTATVNLNVQRLRVDATQTWNVASGRQFIVGNSGSARTGALTLGAGGPFTISKTGAGTVQLDTANTAIGNVNWNVQGGVIRAIWNGSSAWGTGTITLGGGGIAMGTGFTGSVGNWTWNNAITLTSATSSFIDNQTIAGADRWLKLEGAMSGSGNLEFRDTGTGFTNIDAGFILAGTNTNTGTVTITSGAEVRVGGANPGTQDDIAGNNGKLAGDAASVVNNGTLTFSRLDSHTVANAISGSGNLRIGMVNTLGGSSTATQNVTLSNASTYSGTTTVNNGTLTVTGSLSASSAVSVATAARLAGTGTVAGTVAVASGGILSPGVANAGTLTLGSLTFGTATGNTASILMPVSAGGTLDSQLSVSGNVVANGGANSVTFGFGSNLASLSAGTYTLMSYSGTQLADISAFTYSGTPGGRQTLALVNGTNAINLQVGNAFVTWSGAAGSSWTASNNWILSSDNQPTTFAASDATVFGDSGATGTVDLATNVNPATITFSGNTLAYTINSGGGFGITTGGLFKTGAATVTINTANSFTGGTQLTAGTLVLGADTALGSGAVSLEGGTLDVNGRSIANAVVLAGGGIAGNGGVVSGIVSEAGGSRALVVGSSLTLLATNTYTGGTTVNAGTLTVGNGGATGALGTGAVSVAAGATLVFNRSVNFTVADVISAPGTVTKAGASRLTVSGNNSGGVVNWRFAGTGNGDIGFSNANAIGGSGSTITLADNATGTAFFNTSGNTSGVSIALGTNAVFTWNGSTGNTSTLSGVISGAGGLTKVSGETLILTGANTYSGPTTVTTGVLQVGGSGVLGSGNYAGAVSLAATLFVNTSANQTLAGTISGGGRLDKSSTGTLTLTGTNSYSGGTELLGGTLETSALTGVGSGYLAVKNGSTFVYTGSGSETTTRNLFLDLGASRIDLTQATGALTWNDAAAKTGAFTKGGSGSLTIGGSFSGSASVTVLGGLLTLTGTSPYSGATTVSGGTLLANGSLSGTSGVTIASGAVLGGSGTINAAISGAGLVSPGSSPGILAATSLSPALATAYAFEFTAPGSPTYGTASASTNDVLRLTSGTPFVTNLSSANVMDVYFDVASVTAGDIFKGGFYTDTQSDFLPSITNATMAYWVKGNGSGTDRTFNGQGYYSLASYDNALSVTLSTVAETAAFAGGSVGGQVTQFEVVPEPGVVALVGAAIGAAGIGVARRRRRG